MGTINGTAGDDELAGTTGNDTINGLDGNDILYGDAGDDTLNGGNGNDDLEGGAGNDHLNGGDGFDFASYIVAPSGVNVSLAILSAQNTGGAGTDTISGVEGLIGSSFNDTLTGDGGNNILDGGAGRDTLVGGAGNDILQVSNPSDYVAGEKYDGGDGYDALTLNGPFDLSTSTVLNIEELDTTWDITVAASQLNGLQALQAETIDIKTAGVANLVGAHLDLQGFNLEVGGITLNLADATGGVVVQGSTGIDNVTGGSGIDNIYGNSGSDTISGGAGDDFLQGDDGADTIDGGDGKDVLNGNAGEDIITGGAGDDVINGDDSFSHGNDTISGGDGNDEIHGDGGTDTINGDGGNDTIDGIGTLNGGDGDDVIDGSGTLSGGTGNDRINAENGNNNLSGDAGDDFLVGGDGNDTLDGGDDNDTLDGGGGSNTLHGGAGNDTLRVGIHDTVVDGGDGDDIIAVEGNTLPRGVTITGGAGIDMLRLDGSDFDLTGATLNHDIEGIVATLPYFVLTATAAQLDGLKVLQADTVEITTAGTVDLTGAALTIEEIDLQAKGTTIDLTDSTGRVSVFGSSGNDTMTGGDGGGVLAGQNGDDVLTAGNGDTVLDGSAGNDILTGGNGNDVLQGDQGRDIVNGGGGDDQIYIRDGSELASGEQYSGGSGVDTLFVSFFADLTHVTLGADIENLDAHFQTLTLTASQLAGFTGSVAANAIHLTTGGAIDLSGAQVSAMEIDLAAANTQIILPQAASGAANYTVIGNNGDDQITGGAKDDILKGGNGDDVLHGGDGNDQLYGGTGVDVLDGGNGNDVIHLDSANGLTNGSQFIGGGGMDTLQISVDGVDISNTVLSGIEEINAFTVSMTAAQLGGLQAVSADEVHITTGGTIDLSGAIADVNTFYLSDAGNTLILPTDNSPVINVYVEGGAGNDTIAGGYVYGKFSGNGGDDVLDASKSTDDLDLDGGDGNDVLIGGVHMNRLYGGAGDDQISFGQGGQDTVQGGDGDDVLAAGAALTSTDTVDGGTGQDALSLDGDYSAGLKFSATTMVNVEALTLGHGHSYNLTTNDATVASGALLTVDGSALGSHDGLIFDGSAEHNGRFAIIGGAGNDTLTGGTGNDSFDLSKGGTDTASGGAGNDIFILGGMLESTDSIDGGAGSDTLILDGNYAAGLVFSASMMTNVETLQLSKGHSYNLTMSDGNVAAGATLTVDGTAIKGSGSLTFDGSAEHDGNFVVKGTGQDDLLTGGDGADKFMGGKGDDILTGGNGADFLNGARGSDTFVYAAAGQSTSAGFDTITGFDIKLDKIDVWFSVTGVDAMVTHGDLSLATFDQDMATALGASQLEASHAVVYTPTSGDFAGEAFLVIDANGIAGYQAGQDLVIELDNSAHLSHLKASAFI